MSGYKKIIQRNSTETIEATKGLPTHFLLLLGLQNQRQSSFESQFQKLESDPGLKGETYERAARAFRAWEDLNTGLGSMEAPTERFELILTTLRADLAALGAELDEIEKDEY